MAAVGGAADSDVHHRPYWLFALVLGVVVQVLLSCSGLSFRARFVDPDRRNRWVERAFHCDVPSLRRR